MTSSGRAVASRQNGAASHGPRTAVGKTRSARNALKHGFSARKTVLLDDENAADFKALAATLQAELAPEGRLQADLVGRIVMASWRAQRSDRIEAALLARYLATAGSSEPDPRSTLGAALTRDANGPRTFEILVRYRGSVLAELFRSLAMLKLLQAEAGDPPGGRTERLARRAAAKRTRETGADQAVDRRAP